MGLSQEFRGNQREILYAQPWVPSSAQQYGLCAASDYTNKPKNLSSCSREPLAVLLHIMTGPLLSGDRQTSRRRWVVVAAVFTLILLLFTVSSQYRSSQPHDLEHRPPQPPSHTAQPASQASSQPSPVKPVPDPQFTKPKDVPIVGFIFFGRRSRVEILRCYIEVR